MKRLIYLLAALPLLCFSGCDKESENWEDTGAKNSSSEIKFDFNIGSGIETKTNTSAFSFVTSWTTGDEVGLYIVKGSSSLQPSGNYADNVKLTRQSNSTWAMAAPVYYPNDGDKLSFYAYFPYDAGMSNPRAYTFNVPLDQAYNIGEYFKKYDFLWAKQENVGKSSNAVPLQFSHALAMIEIAITSNDFNPPTATILNVVTDCTVNLGNQNITPCNTKNTIQMWPRHGINYVSYNWALVPPQTMDICVVWTKNNIAYIVTPATNVTLTSGNIKKYSTTQP